MFYNRSNYNDKDSYGYRGDDGDDDYNDKDYDNDAAGTARRRNEYYSCPIQQRHVHEVQGSVEVAERGEDAHCHRFATVSGEAAPCGYNDHYHEVIFTTDFEDGHYHNFYGCTGGAIRTGDRHVHYVESVTTRNDGHKHKFKAATLIEA